MEIKLEKLTNANENKDCSIVEEFDRKPIEIVKIKELMHHLILIGSYMLLDRQKSISFSALSCGQNIAVQKRNLCSYVFEYQDTNFSINQYHQFQRT